MITQPLLQLSVEHVTEKKEARGDDASSKLYDLTNLALEECNAASLLSDPNTVIYLFHKTLNQCLAPHPMRSHSLKDFAEALLMRFCLTNRLEDLDQAILLHNEVVPELDDVLTGLREFQLDIA